MALTDMGKRCIRSFRHWKRQTWAGIGSGKMEVKGSWWKVRRKVFADAHDNSY